MQFQGQSGSTLSFSYAHKYLCERTIPSQIQYNILIMDTVKNNRISPFKEWLAQQNLNENKTGNVNATNKYIYEYAEYSSLLNEAYCNLKFDHYNEVFDQCLNDIEKEAPGLKHKDVITLAQNKTGIENEYDSIDKFLYDLVKMHLRGEKIKVQDKEIDDETVNDNDLQVYRAAEKLFILQTVKDIKQKFVYEETE